MEKNLKILTVKEVSELLNVEISTVYAWAEQRKIPSFKMNGSLRFSEGDIKTWIEACKRPAEAYNNSRR